MVYKELITLLPNTDKQKLENFLGTSGELSLDKNQEGSPTLFQNEKLKLINNWIKLNPSGLRPLPQKIEGLNNRFIFITVDFEIRHESNEGGKLWPLIQLLETALNKCNRIDLELLAKTMSQDINSYAGATRESEIAYLMEDYFGLGKSLLSSDLEDIEVRIWADLLADEIEKRFHASKSED
jgi:hypothetical protein